MRNKRPIIVMFIMYITISIFGVVLLLPSVQTQLADFSRWNGEAIALLFVLFLAVIIVSITMLAFYMSKDKTEKDDKQYYSIGSNSRKQEYLEREIAGLNERLVASENNWKTVYQLLLSSQIKQNDVSGSVSTSRFLKNFGIDYDNITIKNDFVFVLTPFHPDFEDAYFNICETCRSLKLSAMRSDEEYVKTDLLKHIMKCIVEARVIVANIDGRNANVFYELGIAHALNKPTILISKVDSSVPFDVQGQYVILYHSAPDLQSKLRESLLKVLTSNNN